MVKKQTGNIDMSFTSEENKPEPITNASETFEKEGHTIYKKDETGFMQFYDTDNNPIADDVIEKISDAYQLAPYINDRGDEQDGGLRVRYVKHEKQVPKNPTDPVIKNVDCSIDDCEFVEERQYYKNGEAIIHTIPKKLYYVVKYLRGEYDEDAKENKENKEEGNQ